MDEVASFLVLTAFTDETQLRELRKSIQMQKGVRVVHQIITGLDALAAEGEIYNKAVINRFDFDYIIKIDADMVVLKEDLLLLLHSVFSKNIKLNRISLPVNDFFTNKPITGIHCVRASNIPLGATVKPPRPDKWFKKIHGLLILDSFEKYISHGFNPSIKQAIRFGVHRAIKARLGGMNDMHWITLEDLHNHWRSNKENISLCAAMSGAMFVFDLPESGLTWNIISEIRNDKSEALTYFEEQHKNRFFEFNKLTSSGFWLYFDQSGGILRDKIYFIGFKLWRFSRCTFDKVRWQWYLIMSHHKSEWKRKFLQK